MFDIYNNVTRGTLTISFFLFFAFFCVYLCLFVVVVVIFFPFFPFFSPSYYLFKPSNYIITTIITIMFINITVMSVLEKSSGGEFQARNSSGMVYPYSPRKVMSKPFQRCIQDSGGAFCDISGFWAVVCHREPGIGCCESPTCVMGKVYIVFLRGVHIMFDNNCREYS